MARKVTLDDINKWLELRGRGYSFKRIGEETGWNEETVRNHIGKEQVAQVGEKKELEADLEIEAKAFTEFEVGKNPVDLVKAKICSASMAKEIREKYGELSNKKLLSGQEIESLKKSEYLRGHSDGFVEAREKYLVEIPCVVCGKPMEPTSDLKEDLTSLINSVIAGGFEFAGRNEKLRKWEWGHAECHKKGHPT